MRFKGKNPSIRLIDKEYELGNCLSKEELKPFFKSFVPSKNLPKWDVVVNP